MSNIREIPNMATQHQDVNGNHEFLDKSYDKDAALRKIQTAGSISISPELFEKLYLSPKDKVKGDLRQTFGKYEIPEPRVV